MRNPFSRKPSEQRTLPEQRASAPFFVSGASASGATVTPENALVVADAFAWVRALADAAASLPLVCYRRTEGGRERLGNRADELLSRPAPGVTQAGLVGTVVAHLCTHGNCFLGKYRDGDGRVQQLAPLPPGSVTVELKGGIPIFTLASQGRLTTHTEQDICHIKSLSTDGLVGLSPVRQCREALGLNTRLLEHSARFFQNDSRPPGILRVPTGPEAQDSIENLREAWEARHAGAQGAHRIAIVQGDVEFQPVGLSAEDAQFLGQRQLSATEVCRIFRVPPWMIGAPTGDSLTYSTVEQQGLAFATYGLRPQLVAVEQALSNDRDLFGRNQYCEFLIDALLRSDSKTRAEVYEKALSPETGWLTRDEVRRMENLKPDGDQAPAPTPEEAQSA